MEAAVLDQIAILERMLEDGQNIRELEDGTIQAGLQRARRLITDLSNRLPEARRQLGLERFNNLVQTLQNLAFNEPDTGGNVDVASWCERQWAETLQLHSHNVTAMRGLGHCWLLKAQPPLARVYAQQDSPASSEGSRRHRLGISRPRPDPSEAEDTARIQSADYVEARSLLRPALEYLDRAVEEAEAQGSVTGKLLEICAEAYMSFGNVSHPRNNEIAYQKALRLLRQANDIKDFTMDAYLEEFLDENIDYIQ